MRIVHIADVHLGYRAYSRVTTRGLNQREADVFRAFQSALERSAELDPDIVLLAGDLFHTVRPSNFTIYQTFRLLSEFRTRSAAPIVIIGGNHDTPKSLDTGCILDLFTAIPDVHVRHHGFEGILFPDLDAAVYCLPYFSVEQRREWVLRPEKGPAVNILAVHGTIEGAFRHSYDSEQINPGELHPEEWDYIALGHYHIRTEVAPNCHYSGAVEFTSSNIWEECTAHPKGFLLYDTNDREATFHQLRGVRRVVDCKPIEAASCSAEELMQQIDAVLQPHLEDLPSCIVRVSVEGFPRQLQRELDWQRIRELKNTALHLDLLLRPAPQEARRSGDGLLHAARPLEAEWEDYAAGLADVPRGVERDRLAAMGLEYLSRAADAEAAA